MQLAHHFAHLLNYLPTQFCTHLTTCTPKIQNKAPILVYACAPKKFRYLRTKWVRNSKPCHLVNLSEACLLLAESQCRRPLAGSESARTNISSRSFWQGLFTPEPSKLYFFIALLFSTSCFCRIWKRLHCGWILEEF